MILRTARLALRRAEMSDLAAMHAMMSDAETMRYWATLPHADLDVTRAWLSNMVADPEGLNDDFVLVHDGSVVGHAGAWRMPEIGFMLHRDHRGKGLMSEAMAAVIPHLFARHDVPALTADVDPRNAASLALLSALGFSETGRAERTFLLGAEWADSIYLHLPRADWRGVRPR